MAVRSDRDIDMPRAPANICGDVRASHVARAIVTVQSERHREISRVGQEFEKAGFEPFDVTKRVRWMERAFRTA